MEKELELFVPGRLCIFGEHSDWAGFHRQINSSIVPGMAIVSGIEQGIYARVRKHHRFIVRSEIDKENGALECNMDQSELKAIALSGSYYSYVTGVASYIKEHYNVEGLEIIVTKRTLPMKAGMSSSASICVLVTRAFNLLYDLRLSTTGEMMVAYHGEQRTLSRCGRLDQACAFGVRPVCMHFDGADIEVEPLKVKKELNFVLADLNAGKDTIKILTDLNKCYPFAETEKEKRVHEALGIDNQKIVKQAIKYIETGNIKKLGSLMTKAQALFDQKVAPACPDQLSSPVLHSVLEDKIIKTLTYGGKGVGSQGDGSVQFLAKDKKTQKELVNYLKNVLQMTPYAFTIRPHHIVKKAIIPVAGFGTRLYPATRGIKKEFLPVVDKDGLCKPAILILLEELDRTGIENICLILADEEDKHFYKTFFNHSLSEDHLSKLPKNMKGYENTIQRIGQKLHFVIQKEKLGFGHAVYQSKSFAGDKPVLLCLGDQIYHSYSSKSCTQQLIEAYERNNKLTVSIHAVPVEEVIHYGILAGEWENRGRTCMNVKQFVEKPTVEYAKEHLGCKTLNSPETYYAIFGQYILTPDVFYELQNIIEGHKTKSGEIQLTTALKKVMEKDGMYAIVMNGESYDIGHPKAYMNTMLKYAGKSNT